MCPTPPCTLATILPETTVRAYFNQIGNASHSTNTFLTFLKFLVCIHAGNARVPAGASVAWKFSGTFISRINDFLRFVETNSCGSNWLKFSLGTHFSCFLFKQRVINKEQNVIFSTFITIWGKRTIYTSQIFRSKKQNSLMANTITSKPSSFHCGPEIQQMVPTGGR